MSDAVERVTQIPRLEPRKSDAHKGDFGHVLCVAGSRGMTGAAVLCGSAACRGGAGLSIVATPQSCWPIVASSNPCLMTMPLAEDDGKIAASTLAELKAARADVVVIGPGLGQSAAIATVIVGLLRVVPLPMVLDADALNAITAQTGALRYNPGPRILTPHPGEMARLMGGSSADVQRRREEVTVEFVRRFGGIIVLKGQRTLVSDGKRIFENTTGNPGMATGGSGDVLAGLIGALLAQNLEPFDAAQLGVYLHGLAGDLGRVELGEASLTASDLLDYLPRAFVRHGSTPTEGT